MSFRLLIVAWCLVAAAATQLRHKGHVHGRHHTELVQAGKQAPNGVFDAAEDMPAENTNVQSAGIVDNSGAYQDELIPTATAAQINAPPTASLAQAQQVVAAPKSVAASSVQADDSDGEDASDLIDGPEAATDQEAMTREDIIEASAAQQAQLDQQQQRLAAMQQQQKVQQVQQEVPQQEEVAPAPVAALATTGSKVTYAAKTTSGAQQPSGVTRPKGWDQCLKFSRYIKSQDVTGVELVRVWKSTCEPAVQSGSATERYRLMCNSLGGAVEPYASQLDYNVENLCDSVLAVFHDVTAVDAKAR